MKQDRITDTIALRKLMVEKHLNATGLAKKSGVSRQSLSNILNGKSQPSADVMNKLLEALEIPLEEAGAIFFKNNLHIE